MRNVFDKYRRKFSGEKQYLATDIEIIRKDGNVIPVEFSGSWINYQGERAYLIFIRDITKHKILGAELKRTLADLERSGKELEQFANIASHNLKNPLRLIRSFNKLLSRQNKGKIDSDDDGF